MRKALARLTSLWTLALLVAVGAGFAPRADNTSLPGLCSIVPVATFRDASISYFVATAKADTVLAGPGQVHPGTDGGHWGPASNRAIYGQLVTIDRLAGAAAPAAESAFAKQGSREALLIPWDYDAGCEPVRWARSARWVIDSRPGFYRARPRASGAWIEGRPTYDVFRADIEPYPHGRYFERGYRASDSAQAPGALTAAEYFDLYSALPDLGETRRDPIGARARLAEWERSHPAQASRFPATRVLDYARRAISSDARMIAPRDTAPLAVLAAKLAGEWGWIANGPGCRENPHTISFSSDGRFMDVSYREAVDSAGVRVKRYEIRGWSGNHVRGLIVSPPETRRTAAGAPVVWDLVITAPDVYNWHRTDWPEGAMTRAVVRCRDLRAPASDPEGTARVFLEASAAQQFLVAAELTDPAELRRNRLAFDSLLAADGADFLGHRVFRVDSVAQLRRMSDAEFSARLQTFTGLLRTDPSFWTNVRGVDIVGSVRQGTDTAHVVYRWRFPSDSLPMRSVQATTMIRSSGRWWAHMLGDYRSLIALLKQPRAVIEKSTAPAGQRQ